MNIYLDINGVLLNHDLTPAMGAVDFLARAFEKGDVYWLTTHCKGDKANAAAYLKRFMPKEAHSLIDRIEKTDWDVLKTDGIDFGSDFLWFDDNIMESERRVLAAHGCEDKLVHVDLKSNPRQLDDLLR